MVLVVIPHVRWAVRVLDSCLLGFAVPAFIAINNKQGGDTLTQNICRWLKTDTPVAAGPGWRCDRR